MGHRGIASVTWWPGTSSSSQRLAGARGRGHREQPDLATDEDGAALATIGRRQGLKVD
jgi:hypothetical protein